MSLHTACSSGGEKGAICEQVQAILAKVLFLQQCNVGKISLDLILEICLKFCMSLPILQELVVLVVMLMLAKLPLHTPDLR